jgi:hypothetical protein
MPQTLHPKLFTVVLLQGFAETATNTVQAEECQPHGSVAVCCFETSYAPASTVVLLQGFEETVSET